MTLEEAVEILKRHNKWRRGANIEMDNPTLLGVSIDTVVKFFKNPHKEMVNFLVFNAFKLNDKDFKALMKKLNQREEK